MASYTWANWDAAYQDIKHIWYFEQTFIQLTVFICHAFPSNKMHVSARVCCVGNDLNVCDPQMFIVWCQKSCNKFQPSLPLNYNHPEGDWPNLTWHRLMIFPVKSSGAMMVPNTMGSRYFTTCDLSGKWAGLMMVITSSPCSYKNKKHSTEESQTFIYQ